MLTCQKKNVMMLFVCGVLVWGRGRGIETFGIIYALVVDQFCQNMSAHLIVQVFGTLAPAQVWSSAELHTQPTLTKHDQTSICTCPSVVVLPVHESASLDGGNVQLATVGGSRCPSS
jgi:hypothetical protein